MVVTAGPVGGGKGGKRVENRGKLMGGGSGWRIIWPSLRACAGLLL